jgi:hypothetical protein
MKASNLAQHILPETGSLREFGRVYPDAFPVYFKYVKSECIPDTQKTRLARALQKFRHFDPLYVFFIPVPLNDTVKKII